jgi:uncharacterized protein YdeI (YjbR/CyaY-like superfamily)
MPTDTRVDKYITGAPDFARPMLERFRELVHKGVPEAQEDIKWSRPSFLYRDKILFGMSAFKAYCGFFVFNPDVNKLIEKDGKISETARQLDRVSAIDQLPSEKDLLRYICEARRLLDAILSSPAPRKRTGAPKPEAEIPNDFAAALSKNKTAAKAFHGFSPSHRREYVEWITEAKRDETRQKRIATTLEWLVEGKPRNWKYMNC